VNFAQTKTAMKNTIARTVFVLCLFIADVPRFCS